MLVSALLAPRSRQDYVPLSAPGAGNIPKSKFLCGFRTAGARCRNKEGDANVTEGLTVIFGPGKRTPEIGESCSRNLKSVCPSCERCQGAAPAPSPLARQQHGHESAGRGKIWAEFASPCQGRGLEEPSVPGRAAAPAHGPAVPQFPLQGKQALAVPRQVVAAGKLGITLPKKGWKHSHGQGQGMPRCCLPSWLWE